MSGLVGAPGYEVRVRSDHMTSSASDSGPERARWPSSRRRLLLMQQVAPGDQGRQDPRRGQAEQAVAGCAPRRYLRRGGLFVDAVRETQRRPGVQAGRTPQRGAVGQEFREMKFHGATGRTDFGTSRVGERRNLSILEIANVHDFEQQPTCAYLTGDLYDENAPRLAAVTWSVKLTV